MTTAQRTELVNLMFSVVTAERQSAHHGSYRFVCDIDGDLVFSHRAVGNVVRVL